MLCLSHLNEFTRKYGLDSDKRLTFQRYALAVIKQYKPFFARVPLGNGKGMAPEEHLSLEVDFIETIGLPHDGLFGEPRDIEQDEDIKLWVAGLKEGGGGGYVPISQSCIRRCELTPIRNVLKQTKTYQKDIAPISVKKPYEERHGNASVCPTERLENIGEKTARSPKSERSKNSLERVSPASLTNPQAQPDLLKVFRRKWKVRVRFH